MRNKTVKISVVIMLFAVFYIFLLGSVVSYFVNTDEYIQNSNTIQLDSIEFVSHKREGYGYGSGSGSGKEVLLIKADTTYYQLLFYEKSKADYYFKQFDLHELRKANRLIIKINSIELKKHKGSVEDPIPVFNFAFKPKENIWNIETYEYNVKRYLVYENILKSNVTMPVAMIILLAFIIISAILIFGTEEARIFQI